MIDALEMLLSYKFIEGKMIDLREYADVDYAVYSTGSKRVNSLVLAAAHALRSSKDTNHQTIMSSSQVVITGPSITVSSCKFSI